MSNTVCIYWDSTTVCAMITRVPTHIHAGVYLLPDHGPHNWRSRCFLHVWPVWKHMGLYESNPTLFKPIISCSTLYGVSIKLQILNSGWHGSRFEEPFENWTPFLVFFYHVILVEMNVLVGWDDVSDVASHCDLRAGHFLSGETHWLSHTRHTECTQEHTRHGHRRAFSASSHGGEIL